MFCLVNLLYPTLNINLKMNTHPWPKSLQKDTIQLSHMSFTTLITPCCNFLKSKVSCCLHNVLSLEMPFASRQIGKWSRYSDSDWLIDILYCRMTMMLTMLFSLQYFSDSQIFLKYSNCHYTVIYDYRILTVKNII
jgi:hypothetical protein